MREKEIDLTAKVANDHIKRAEMFHTSGYARAQNKTGIGAGGQRMDTARRATIEARRRFVSGYQSARIMQRVGEGTRMQIMASRAKKDEESSTARDNTRFSKRERQGAAGQKPESKQAGQSSMQKMTERQPNGYRPIPRGLTKRR